MENRMAKGVLVLGLVGFFAFLAGAQTLNVWIATTFVDAQNNWLRAQTEQWAKETGIDVNISIFPKEIYAEKIMAAIEAKNPPDVVLQGAAGPVHAAELGLLVPLDEVIGRLGRDDFYPVVLQYHRVTDPETGEAHVYGIPLFFEPRTVEIRYDLLQEAGIEIPEKPTYGWLIETARALNNPPDIYGWGLTLGKCYDAHDNIMLLVHHYGGGLISDRGPLGADVFNSEPTWQAFSLMKDLYREGIVPPDSVAWTDFDNNLAFMEGRIAITINGLSIYYKMVEEGNPIADVTKEIFLDMVCDTGLKSAFVFRSTSDKEELGKDLIYYILSDKEGYRINMCEKAQLYGLPIFKSQGEIISHQWAEGQWDMFAVDPMSCVEGLKASWAMSYPLGEPTSVSERVMGSLLIPEKAVKLFTQDADPKDVAAEIAAEVNALLAKTYGAE
jgi:multiple sugar transport system substrate-binding protein